MATKDNIKRSILAQGRDIYAVTAPLVVETVNRILSGKTTKTGITTIGEAFDAAHFLQALDQDDITISNVEESKLK